MPSRANSHRRGVEDDRLARIAHVDQRHGIRALHTDGGERQSTGVCEVESLGLGTAAIAAAVGIRVDCIRHVVELRTGIAEQLAATCVEHAHRATAAWRTAAAGVTRITFICGHEDLAGLVKRDAIRFPERRQQIAWQDTRRRR